MSNKPVRPELAATVEKIWREQLASYDDGRLVAAEHFLETHCELMDYPELAVDVIFNEYELRCRDQVSPQPKEFLDRFPQFQMQLERQFRLLSAIEASEAEQMETIISDDQDTVVPDSPSHRDTSRLIPERFRDCTVIGRGATATVERAFDEHLQQDVAIKRLHPHLTESARANRRLQVEAQTMARLHHPHIVPIREILEDDGQLVLVSRFVKGTHLGELVEQSTARDLPQIVIWVRQIADALQYAHENGVTHRDVKPSNIIVDENGKALLVDFGLAAFSESSSSITHTGELIGTPAFMSPEQAKGQSGNIDCRTDIYSLGATLYFLLSGRPPFEGAFSKVLQQVIDAEPKPVSSPYFTVPVDLKTITAKCLKKIPADRYQTARELGDDLRRFQSGEVILARRTGPLEKIIKYSRRRPYLSTAVVTAVLLAVFLLGALLQLGQVRDQRNRAISAEKKNRELLAAASVDAGLLSMQRGSSDLAVQHFENSLDQGVENPGQVHLFLVDCHLAQGDVDLAAKHLEQARTQGGDDPLPTMIQYWQSELAALQHPAYASDIDSIDLGKLDKSKRQFLMGLQSTTSIEALTHFQNSIKADPYHHSARRLYLIMALSLARFEDVLDGAALAREIYPNDVDFCLIEAVATAATGDAERAKTLVNQARFDDEEKQNWIELCDFVCNMTSEIIHQDAIETEHLQLVSEQLSQFTAQHLSSLESRRWRFPKSIGEKFSRLQTGSVNDHDELQAAAKELVLVHPEATLLAIVAENELRGAGLKDYDQLTFARDRFLEATRTPTYLQLSHEASWLGLYTTAMILNLQKQDAEENLRLMLNAAEEIDPTWLKSRGHVRGVTIPLIKNKQWDLAIPFVDYWIEMMEQDDHIEEAYWHLAICYQGQEEWLKVIETCNQVEAAVSEDFEINERWEKFRKHAQDKAKELFEASPSAEGQ